MDNTSSKKVAVIGAGFSGLSAASYLAKYGYDVTIFEKNSIPGGRARQYKKDGFSFDMGPTWYWMPDVFEDFFKDFNKGSKDFYELDRLNPGYKVFFGVNDSVNISADIDEIYNTFEKEEPGSSKNLKEFLNKAKFNYQTAMDKIVYMPGKTPFELISTATIKRVGQFFKSIKTMVRSGIKNPRLAQILEFPVLFLGAKPENTPAFYCFMNYADMVLGTWYPKKGMYSVVKGFEKLAVNQGVKINFNSPVEKIEVENNKVIGLYSNSEFHQFDAVLSGADYYHTETLLETNFRNYSERYWSKKIFAPSALLFYVGFNKKLKNISHHTLFFDSPFDKHAQSIYDDKSWPVNPLFYASFPSVTDETAAPDGHESAIFLIPIATNIRDDENIREKFFNEIIKRFEKLTQQSVKESVILKRSYCVNDFKQDYNAYGGNAYGLSNILTQTAFLKPKIQNKKLNNLFYAGQLTVPGPGVPPAIISGKIVSNQVNKYLKNTI